MRSEEKIAVRTLLKLMLPAGVLGAAALQLALYSHGSDPLFFVLLFGVPIVLVICARLIIRRRMIMAADTSELGSPVALVKRLLEALIAAVRRARRRRRVRRVEHAALKAAQGDTLLSPEGVRTAAEALFRLVHLALGARDPGRLATLLGPELLAAWQQDPASRDGLSGRHEVVGDVLVDYICFTRGERPNEDRVVVLIEAALRHAKADRSAPRIDRDQRRVCQYWTLGISDGAFIVLEIEEQTDGAHHLDEPIGTAPTAASATRPPGASRT